MDINYEYALEMVKQKKSLDVTDENIMKKLKFCVEYFDFNSTEELLKFALRNPTMLTFRQSSIAYKMSVYQVLLDLDNDEVIAMIKELPSLLNNNVDTTEDESNSGIRAKIKFFQEFFGINKAELGQLISKCPTLLELDISEDSPIGFKAKVDYYKSTFDLDNAEVARLIQGFPSIIRYDVVTDKPTGMRSKVTALRELGFSNQQILDNPYILGAPALKVKFRYMILSCAYTDEQIVNNNYFMVSDEKLYARFMYLAKFNLPKVLRAGLHADEKRFQKCFGISSDQLKATYPLMNSGVEFIEKNYNYTHFDKPLHLTKKERSEILGQHEFVLAN